MRVESIDWAELRQFGASERLLEVLPARVAMLSRGRNAWRSNWIETYQGETAMFSNSESARLAAEPLRGPGNVFYVNDAPALVLRGVRVSCVLVDFHPDNPFGRYTGLGKRGPRSGLYPGIPLTQAILTFRNLSGCWSGPTPSEHSLRSGRLNDVRNLTKLDRRRLGSFASFAQGTDWNLGWRENASRFSRAGTYAVAKGWAEKVGDVPNFVDLLGAAHAVERAMSPAQNRDAHLLHREQIAGKRADAANVLIAQLAPQGDEPPDP